MITTEMEIEYKSIINYEKYKSLQVKFGDFAKHVGQYIQKNYFFDTTDFKLNKLGVTLRIREKKDTYQMQVKVQTNKQERFTSNEERIITISETDLFNYMQVGINSDNELVKQLILDLNLDEKLVFNFIGYVITERIDYKHGEDTISLDKNYYNNLIDFELEWETEKHDFVEKFASEHNILFGNAKGKRNRLIKTLK